MTAITEIALAMALLARCPACDCELELPSDAPQALADKRVECPACSHKFLIPEAHLRTVMTARPVDTTESEPSESAPEAKEEPAASDSFGAATLASFLDDADEIAKRDAAEAEKPQQLNLGNFKSLDELFSKVSAGPIAPKTPAEEEKGTTDQPNLNKPVLDAPMPEEATTADDLAKPELDGDAEQPTAETEAPGFRFKPLDLSEFQTADVAADETDEEPSPAADRLRPTLGDLLGGSSSFDATKQDTTKFDSDDHFDSNALESDQLDAEPEDEETPAKSAGVASLEKFIDEWKDSPVDKPVEAPVAADLDFGTDDNHFDSDEHDGSKSLRASMGLLSDTPLEADESPLPVTDEVEDEMQFSGVQAPSGKVATRRRSKPSLLKFAFGGVTSIGVAFLIAPLAVMWINHYRNNPVEPFGVAQYYPDAIKPAEFRSIASSGESSNSTEPDEGIADGFDAPPSDVIPASHDAEILGNSAPEPWDNTATPAPLETKLPRIADAPKYPAATLMQLTSEAKQATSGLLDGSFEVAELRLVKGTSYAQIAALADALTFGEGGAESSWANEARTVFPPLFASDKSQQEISLIASFWLTSSRRTHGGIFFCGTPDAGRQSGSVAEYVFTLPTSDHKQVTVVAPVALSSELTSANSIAVVGSVIDNPAERIEGYTGSAERVIWTNFLLPINE